MARESPDFAMSNGMGMLRLNLRLRSSLHDCRQFAAQCFARQMCIDARVAFLLQLVFDLIDARNTTGKLKGSLNDTHPRFHTDHYLTAIECPQWVGCGLKPLMSEMGGKQT